MRLLRSLAAFVIVGLLVGCSAADWNRPTPPSDQTKYGA